jgi:glycine/D-amino acid oxidase-like deaminating enzyme
LTVTRRHPLWRDLLDEHEEAALDPGVPDRLPRTPDVLVVGGGIVGVATAVSCQRAGMGTVALVERSTLGAGATAGAGGLLVPEAHHDDDPGGVVDLGRSSLALWRDLDDLVPSGVGLVDMEWLGLDPQPGLCAHLPPGAEVLGAAEVALLVPELARPVGGVLVRDQARVNPLGALSRLAGGLDHPATGVGVTGVATSGGRVVRVSTTAGSVSPGTVVFATGAPPAFDELAVSVPASLVKGHIVATEPIPLRLGVAVPPMVTQVDEGRLLAGGTLDHQDQSPDVDDAVVANIRADLEAALPAVGRPPISHAWCCFRPAHPDEHPVVDRVPRLANAWMTSGHFRTGILMAPATGRALARWIDRNEQPDEVRGLELARFS